MTTQVQICNLALAKLGDEAQVSSVAPPDGSMQAAYCALFYPQALAVLLTKHDWSFATVTAPTSATANVVSGGGSGVAGVTVDNVTGITPGMWAVGSNLPLGTTVSSVTPGSNLLSSDGIVYRVCRRRTGLYVFERYAAAGWPVGLGRGRDGSVVNGVNNNPAWAYAYNLPVDFYQLIECRDAVAVGLPVGYGPFYRGGRYSVEPGVEYAMESWGVVQQ